MDRKNLFPIGEVSKLFHISVSSLRHYEHIGLLTPEYISSDSGYRYYGTEQFEVLNTIRYLRALDMPLAEIEDFLKNKDISRIEEKLLQQKHAVLKKQQELQRIEQKINHRLNWLRDAQSVPLDTVSLIELPSCRIVWVDAPLKVDGSLDMEVPIRKLDQSDAEAVVFLGKVGLGISAEHLQQSKVNRYDSIFLILDQEDIYTGETIIIVGVTFEKLFQAVGNMKTTMISLMCGCITNIVLDPVLIFGYGPFPEMGIEGAALATGIGQALTLAIYLVVYLARPIRVHIRRQYILPSKKMVIKLYSIGIPATLNLALPSLLISALNAILAAYSEVYILVLGIYYKLQTFVYLPANGIVQGMRPLIGYNYGAGEHQRVSQIFKIVLCMSGIIMVFGTVICLLIPGQLMGLFTHTEATIQTGETALRIIGAGFIVSAVSVTSSGALEGLGKGTPSLLISLCRYVVVIIPTAFLLSRFFGAVGVWNAFWITEAITAIISICVYYKAIAQSQLSQSTVK